MQIPCFKPSIYHLFKFKYFEITVYWIALSYSHNGHPLPSRIFQSHQLFYEVIKFHKN